MILAERDAELGGALLAETPAGGVRRLGWRCMAQATVAELGGMPEVTVLRRTTAFGYLTNY